MLRGLVSRFKLDLPSFPLYLMSSTSTTPSALVAYLPLITLTLVSTQAWSQLVCDPHYSDLLP